MCSDTTILKGNFLHTLAPKFFLYFENIQMHTQHPKAASTEKFLKYSLKEQQINKHGKSNRCVRGYDINNKDRRMDSLLPTYYYLDQRFGTCF